jgi:hypothetical protein
MHLPPAVGYFWEVYHMHETYGKGYGTITYTVFFFREPFPPAVHAEPKT